jgi:predicted transposase YbfD/YdcC
MAGKTKIDKTILAFREIVKQYNIRIFGEDIPRKPIRKLMRIFRGVSDVRVQGKVEYPLHEILMVAFLAVMSGIDMLVDIAAFGKSREEWLKKYFYIKNGIPSHDTFRRVLSITDPVFIQKATVTFLVENIKLIKRAFKIETGGMRQLCVDGKTARGTGRLKGTEREIKQLHTLHVYDRTDGICIVSKEVGDKTNEIPVAQEVLRMLNLKDTVVTFDAMNTQKDTIAAIIEQKGAYVAALKGNQAGLHEEVKSYFTPEKLKRIESGGSNYHMVKEKQHNRIETRKYYFTKNVSWLIQLEDWKGLKGLVYYTMHTEDINSGKVTDEAYCYITSLTDITLCADCVRGAWSVENELHWHLDYNFSEDDIEIADRTAYQNISLLNKMALSLLKLIAPLLDCSLRSSRKRISWDGDTLLSVFCALDEDMIADAMLNVKV